MTKFAPVLLFVYNRIETTKQTIIHLKNNTLAHETDLFIYSDGGKDKKSWKQVNMLRQYLRTISGFKNVFLVERRINYYLERNIIDGVTDIIQSHRHPTFPFFYFHAVTFPLHCCLFQLFLTNLRHKICQKQNHQNHSKDQCR